MFENIGQKIKGLSKIIFTAGVILAVIIGIILFCLLIEDGVLAVLSAVACIGIGILLSWLSVMLLYGYGDMVQNISDIRNQLYVANDTKSPQNKTDVVSKPHWVCKNCGRQNAAGSTSCWNCKERPQ